MKPEDFYRVIEIPHLKATLYVQDMSKLRGTKIEGAGFATRLEHEARHTNYCIFFERIAESVKIPANFSMIAHEVMHIIQYICEDYGMTIYEEREHTAYLMSYLLEEILPPVSPLLVKRKGK